MTTAPSPSALPPAPVSPLPSHQRVMPIGGPQYLVNARYGGFLVNQNDYFIGHALLKYGEYAENEWQLLRQIIPVGATVVEVGANIGALTVPIARHVGVPGRVVAIEPQRILHQHLCANVALNGLPNVETHHLGCGARTGTMIVPPVDYITPSRGNFGSVSLQHAGEGEPVAIRTVDDIVGERPVHLLKVDVEGMETDVLRGAKKLLRRHRPLLHVENDRREKSESLILLIRQYGYRPYWHITDLFNAMNFFELKENIYGTFGSVNLLCVPNESTINMQHFTEASDPKSYPLRN